MRQLLHGLARWEHECMGLFRQLLHVCESRLVLKHVWGCARGFSLWFLVRVAYFRCDRRDEWYALQFMWVSCCVIAEFSLAIHTLARSP